MQSKRTKRSRIRAAKDTSGHGSKKKHRGAGSKGGRGKAGSGKRGDVKLMKVTKGKKYLGKVGFTSIKKGLKTINVATLQSNLEGLLDKKLINKEKETYDVDLTKLGYDKLLSKGIVKKKLNIRVNSASKKVVEKIETFGGKVSIPK